MKYLKIIILKMFLFFVIIISNTETGYSYITSTTFTSGFVEVYSGYLDGDTIPDAVYASFTSTGSLLPVAIAWGTDMDDTTYSYASTTFTIIEYPSWEEFDGNFFMMPINLDDEIDDLVIDIWGITTDSTDTLTMGRTIGIFICDTMKFIDTIKIMELISGTAQPFYALDLDTSNFFTNPEKRFGNGTISYILNRFYINQPTVIKNSVEEDVRETKKEPIINIYPNPTADKTNIEIYGLPDEQYQIEVFSIDGFMMLSQKFINNVAGVNNIELNTQNYPPGTYKVIVKDYSNILLRSTLVIIR